MRSRNLLDFPVCLQHNPIAQNRYHFEQFWLIERLTRMVYGAEHLNTIAKFTMLVTHGFSTVRYYLPLGIQSSDAIRHLCKTASIQYLDFAIATVWIEHESGNDDLVCRFVNGKETWWWGNIRWQYKVIWPAYQQRKGKILCS